MLTAKCSALELLRFLGKGITRERHAGIRTRHFDADGLSLGRAEAGRAEHRVLREQFVVNLRHQKISAARVVAPNLACLDSLYHDGRLLTKSGKRQSGEPSSPIRLQAVSSQQSALS